MRIVDRFSLADMNEAAVRRTHARVLGLTLEAAGVVWCAEKEDSL